MVANILKLFQVKIAKFGCWELYKIVLEWMFIFIAISLFSLKGIFFKDSLFYVSPINNWTCTLLFPSTLICRIQRASSRTRILFPNSQVWGLRVGGWKYQTLEFGVRGTRTKNVLSNLKVILKVFKEIICDIFFYHEIISKCLTNQIYFYDIIKIKFYYQCRV